MSGKNVRKSLDQIFKKTNVQGLLNFNFNREIQIESTI